MKSITQFKELYEGKRYGKLVILRPSFEKGEKRDKVLYVWAKCDCGMEKVMFLNNLIYGMSKSCGCVRMMNAAKARRMGSKLTVATPDGPKTIKELSLKYDVPYQRIYDRFQLGVRDVKTLVGEWKRRPSPIKVDIRLNGKSQKEVAEMFKISKQTVSFRLKTGWSIDSDDKWVSPHRGVVGKKVYRMGKRAANRLKKKRLFAKSLDI